MEKVISKEKNGRYLTQKLSYTVDKSMNIDAQVFSRGIFYSGLSVGLHEDFTE